MAKNMTTTKLHLADLALVWSDEQHQAILTIGLLAAFADWHECADPVGLANAPGCTLRGDDEREIIRLYRKVLRERIDLHSAAAPLLNPLCRLLAYEFVVCICHTGGYPSTRQRRFLEDLSLLLALDAAVTRPLDLQAQALAAIAVGGDREVLPPASIDEAEEQRWIVDCAVIGAALENVPESWAAMATAALQTRLVRDIARQRGCDPEGDHGRHFLQALGLGLTPRYVESLGCKLLGAIFGRTGRCDPSAFACTYALGQTAKRYFASGRQMSPTVLQECFHELFDPAMRMQGQFLAQIRQKSGYLDMAKFVSILRGTWT